MNTIKCQCCNKVMSADAAVCDSCGMSLILDTSGNDIASLVNDYLRTVMGDTSIDILCFKYTLANDSYGKPEKTIKKLCSLSDYAPGKKIFLNEDFVELPMDRSFSVELRFTKGSKFTPAIVDIKPTKKVVPNRIGIEFSDAMKARLIIGDTSNSESSSEFKLIIMN